ncbi:MAG: hypothetical protein JJU22_03950 [Gammaproteobacteria bacterium]|nr:hypothetical protein [Gammaproteobacteria bacterium]
MATRGRRPKSPNLHLVEGTHRTSRHGSPDDAAAAPTGLKRPTVLKGEARKAWDFWIAPAYWLDTFHEPAAIAFCFLWAEFRRSQDNFSASKHSQLRAYQQELGLSDHRRRQAPQKPTDPADGYF